MPDPNTLQSRRRAHLALAAVVSVVVVAALVLYRFPPEQYGFYPACPFFALTGWECPGCGMTRAVAALLHAHFAEAWHWNPLVFVVVPGALVWMGRLYWRAVSGERLLWPQISMVPFGATLFAVLLFTLGRNLQ
jgi:phosphoglycerol transferase MdoB-like AlkP superfamily enzyme